MKTPRVDVIIPTYNGLPYLKEAVSSVLAQTFNDFHLTIIDDGSTDETKAYIDGLKDKRVSYRRVKNGGVSAARNVGIKRTTAPLLAFLDSDDIWLPTKLASQVAIMDARPEVGLAYGHQQTINEAGELTGTLRARLRGQVFDRLLSGNQIIGSASMVLVRRAVLEDVGVFPEKFVMGEDWELWLRIAHRYEIDYCDKYLVRIRDHASSSQQQFIRNAKQLLELDTHIAKEFALTPAQRRLLTARLNVQAAKLFYWGRDTVNARRVLCHALRTKPAVVASFDRNSWTVSARILLGSAALRKLKRVLTGSKNEAKS